MRYRIFRKKTYIMQEHAPISAADSNALAARSYEGTEQLRNLLKVLNSYEIYLQIRALHYTIYS